MLHNLDPQTGEPTDLLGVRPASATLAELHGLITLLLADLNTSERHYTREQVARAMQDPANVVRTVSAGFRLTGES
jgi:hypothetical protein